LTQSLQQLGMLDAFSREHAHFEDMTIVPPGTPPLYVSDVLQKTMIAMQESGIEAAAATAVVMVVGMGMVRDPKPPVPIPMIVNRPYLIAIVDEPTGALLMLGHIDDPS
jgi:serpin B